MTRKLAEVSDDVFDDAYFDEVERAALAKAQQAEKASVGMRRHRANVLLERPARSVG